jgi:O-antigen/teichoic acid export membrane protein
MLYYIFGINGVLLGYGISLLLFSFGFIRDYAKHDRSALVPILNPDTKKISEFLSFRIIKSKSRFIMHAYLTTIAQSLTTYADKLIIAPIFGFSTLGMYQIGFQFLVFLAVIPVSLTQYLIPQESSGVERKGVRKVGLLLSVLFATLLYFILPIVVESFFPAYVEAIPSAQIMIIGVIPMTLTAIINAKLLGNEKSIFVVIGSVVFLSSLFALLYTLGSVYQLIGLAVALLTSLSLQSLTVFALSSRLR